MFCPHCGKPLPPDSHFCPACGTSAALAPAGAPASISTSSAGAAAAVSPPKPSILERLRAMKTWKKVLLGIAVFILAIIGLAMLATSGLDEPVKRHFEALRTGDIMGAYSELSVASRQATSFDDFKAMLHDMPALTHVTGESFASRSWNNGQGELKGFLEIEGGGRLPIEVRLVRENDVWKILSYHVTSQGTSSDRPKE